MELAPFNVVAAGLHGGMLTPFVLIGSWKARRVKYLLGDSGKFELAHSIPIKILNDLHEISPKQVVQFVSYGLAAVDIELAIDGILIEHKAEKDEIIALVADKSSFRVKVGDVLFPEKEVIAFRNLALNRLPTFTDEEARMPAALRAAIWIWRTQWKLLPEDAPRRNGKAVMVEIERIWPNLSADAPLSEKLKEAIEYISRP